MDNIGKNLSKLLCFIFLLCGLGAQSQVINFVQYGVEHGLPNRKLTP